MKKRPVLVFLAAFSTAAFIGVRSAPASAQAVFDVRSGAVGADERREMMEAYDSYNLHLAFAQQGGAHVASVDVEIRDAQGRPVWQGVSDGPYLFATLPSGRYNVVASYEGRAKARDIVVGGNTAPLQTLFW